MNNDTHFQRAFHINLSGKGKELQIKDIAVLPPDPGLIWVHLNYTEPAAREWLEQQPSLSPVVVEALLSEETRPRVTDIDDGLLISLRGINNNLNADPEDMISIRMWIEENKVISTGKRRLLSVEELSRDICEGNGPTNAGEFLSDISDRLLAKMGPVIEEVEDSLDNLEEEVLLTQNQELRSSLGLIRRRIIALRRYIAPQRDALGTIQLKKTSWLTIDHKLQLREISDHTTRFVENLDSIRDRASLLHEELIGRLSDSINQRIYILSLVAAIFLPLSFFTGLLGINIPGIPGAGDKHAFWIFCLFLLFVMLIQIMIFRRKKWI
jgi:zinc transporter